MVDTHKEHWWRWKAILNLFLAKEVKNDPHEEVVGPNRARLPANHQKVAGYGLCTVTDWKKYILISWRQSKRDVCTIFSDCGCCIGQENRKGRGPFPDKRRHDDNARIPNKKGTKRQHARGNLSSAAQEEVEHCSKRMPFRSQLSR